MVVSVHPRCERTHITNLMQLCLGPISALILREWLRSCRLKFHHVVISSTIHLDRGLCAGNLNTE